MSANNTLGPIFLKDFYCDGTERTLLSCRSSRDLLGISSCTHGSDVGVHCEGKVTYQVMMYIVCPW